jgi:radical SAM protein with 4Fe4S-binding SPASM domain
MNPFRIAVGPDQLRKTGEYQEVVGPLLAEIDRVYARFIFREPTPEEVARNIRCFFRKLPRFTERRQAVRTGTIRPHLDIRPLSLELDVTTQCNIRCIMCYFSIPQFSSRKREDISIESFARLAGEAFPLCHTVALSNICEPLLHPRFGDLLAIATNWGVPRVTFTTDGLLFDQETIEEVVLGGTDEVCVSIDAATKPTYERIRRKGNFDRLMANLRALDQAKHRHRSPTPRVGFNFVLMRSNVAELPGCVRLARDVGACYVRANHLLPAKELGMESESLAKDPELCNRMLDQTRALASKYRIEVMLPANFQPPAALDPCDVRETSRSDPSRISLPVLPAVTSVVGSSAPGALSGPERQKRDKRLWSFYGFRPWGNEEHRGCLFPWHFVSIDPYGWLEPCGWLGEAMGNIHQESFEEIWNKDRFQALRAEHTDGNLRASCRNCPACGMGDVNDQTSFAPREVLGRDPEGFLDRADAELIGGWAWDRNHPDRRITVDIYDGDRLLAIVTADQFRQDLLDAGKGDGKCAFCYPTPVHLKDDKVHTIRVLTTEGPNQLPGSPEAVLLKSVRKTE